MKTNVFRFLLLLLVAILACSLYLKVVHADERIWVDAKINNQPARLFLDTGSENFCLYRKSAERLGLKFRRVEGPRPYWATDKCVVAFWGISRKERVAVFDVPSYLQPEGDGLVGWRNVRQNIIVFDAIQQKIEFLPNVPKEATLWTTLALRTRLSPGYAVLALEFPRSDGGKGVIFVDTGAESGIGLSPQKWREWKAVHPNQPTTLTAGYTPSAGLLVREQAWAAQLALGPLELADVVVEEDSGIGALVTKEHVATWGMAALKRVDLIVDGRRGIAYVRPKRTPPVPYAHNRLGAVFVPRAQQSDDLVAHVVEHSPASEAGIRNGDVLLKTGERDVTKWRTNPGEASHRPATHGPAGTKLDLTLKRGSQTIKATAVLQEILAPAKSHSSPGSK